jgi:HEPN domain-containing protein
VSSPEPDVSETSRVLRKKAEEDAAAVREFAEIADSIIGFHAQQAVEKWLKAVTAAGGTRHSAIHDINRLIAIVEADGVAVPLDPRRSGR